MAAKLPSYLSTRPEAAWTTTRLFEAARELDRETDEGDDHYWDLIWVLYYHATREVWDLAAGLLSSEAPLDRALGADVLAQLDPSTRRVHPKFWRRSAPLLRRLLQTETDVRVIASLVSALGHLRDPRAAVPLSRYKNHPDFDVRWQLASALPGLDDPVVIDILIEMTRDPDSTIRDWATFGLGRLTEADTPALRDALAARLEDKEGETCYEAIAGLARRRDYRAFEPLRHDLLEPRNSLLLEAAAAFADPRLLELLLLHPRDYWETWQRRDYDEAVQQCQPVGADGE